ncbi:hypothetical protein [Ruania halotolerans]|uniref:hypothetical protein n=1 Tax=Ruania halotolerans TaxID=2897773 RepID=UPI001E645892|nr:hypothetical protein [Ruania halotolerans]UFU07638.1 hypothetical protein LQF10_05925 [Ruania halotolerans]
MTQNPGMSEPTPPVGPAPTPPPERRSALVIAGAVVGGLIVLGALVFGAIALVDSRDDPIDTATPAPTSASPEFEGELYALLLADAEVVTDADGATWLLEDSGWTEARDLSPEALEAYTGTFTSDGDALILTALSFSDEEAAEEYLDQVRTDQGEPVYEGAVREDGSGTRFDHESGEDTTIHWRDDGSAFVFAITGPSGAEAFYAGLSF